MDTRNRASAHTDGDQDNYEAETAKRARKNHSVLIARNRRSQVKSKKRRGGVGESITGMSHRRQRRWNW